MDWFLLAAISMLFYGLQNFLFKFAAKSEKNSIRVNSTTMLTVAAISGIIYMFSQKPAITGPVFVLFVIANGLTYLLSNIFRIESYKFSPASLAAPLARAYVVLTPILAFVIFRESITPLQIGGLTLATFAIVSLTSLNKKQPIRRRQLFFGLMLAATAAAFTTFNNLIGKQAATTADLISFIFFSNLFSFFIALALQIAVNKDKNPVKYLIIDYTSARLGIIIGVINFIAYYLLLNALTTGKAMIVFPLIGLGIIVNSVISAWFFNERLGKEKIIAVIAAVMAVILLR